MGYIRPDDLARLAAALPNDYDSYLHRILAESPRATLRTVPS